MIRPDVERDIYHHELAASERRAMRDIAFAIVWGSGFLAGVLVTLVVVP